MAGLAVGLSWQPYGWWPLLAVGIPLITLLTAGARPRQAFGLGYVFGLAMLGIAVGWVHVLGWWIVVLLVAFEALFFGLLGVALSLSSRLRAWPLAAAASWVAVEFAYSRVPFGGFGWSRLAYAVVDTPLAGFFPVIGVAGVSFLTVLAAELLVYGLIRVWAALPQLGGGPVVRLPQLGGGPVVRLPRMGGGPVVSGLTVVILPLTALVLGGGALTRFQVEPAAGTGAPVRVGIVQGNVPGRGIEALGRMRSVTNNHLGETVDLATRWRTGQVPTPDFILWPENSADIDPLRDSQTYRTVQAAAAVADRPVLVGAVTAGPGPDERQTTALWWDPDTGVQATYHKQNLVPFGEWIPFRQQLLPLVPILAEVGAQSVPGTEPGVLTVPLAGQTIRVGDIICFELAYDTTVHAAVRGGAELLMVQSNNATYGGTGQIEQQFAITRARAMETRREIAVATTNSVSGSIDRNGRVVSRTQEFTAASEVVTMPRRSALTPAVVLGAWPDRVLAALGLLACLAGWFSGRQQRGRRSPTERPLASPGEPANSEPTARGLVAVGPRTADRR